MTHEFELFLIMKALFISREIKYILLNIYTTLNITKQL